MSDEVLKLPSLITDQLAITCPNKCDSKTRFAFLCPSYRYENRVHPITKQNEACLLGITNGFQD